MPTFRATSSPQDIATESWFSPGVLFIGQNTSTTGTIFLSREQAEPARGDGALRIESSGQTNLRTNDEDESIWLWTDSEDVLVYVMEAFLQQ